MDQKTIAVIGAVNLDICGTADKKLVLHESNNGSVNISFGGVGRNIAENISMLGYKVEMITALADDFFGKQIVDAGEKAGIGFSHSIHVPGASCSTYISINANDKDMFLAVNDMKIYDSLTVEFIESQMDFINSCAMVVCDTNVTEEVLTYIANNCKVPLAVDPVSMNKAMKLKSIIGKFTIIKPNVYESEFLSGIKAENDLSLKANADFFHSLGVKYVFISLSEHGAFFSDGNKCGIMPICTKYPLVNASGCGDSFIAAVIWAYLNDKSVDFMAKAGVCAACITGNSLDTVCKDISVEHINKLMNNK